MSEKYRNFVACTNKQLIKDFEYRCLFDNKDHKMRIEQIKPCQLYVYDITDNRHFIFNGFGSFETIVIPGTPDKIRVDTMKAICSAMLKYLCYTKSTTLTNLSNATRIPMSNLYKYQEGQVLPKLTSIIEICNFFNISIDYFGVHKSKEGDYYVFL